MTIHFSPNSIPEYRAMSRDEQKAFVKAFDKRFYRTGRGVLCLAIVGFCIGGALAAGSILKLTQGVLSAAVAGAAGGLVGGLLQYPIYLAAMAKQLKSGQSGNTRDGQNAGNR